jgi:hypothetical protein
MDQQIAAKKKPLLASKSGGLLKSQSRDSVKDMSPTSARNRFVRGGSGAQASSTTPSAPTNGVAPSPATGGGGAGGAAKVSPTSADWRASKLRIFSVLKHWVKKYPEDFTEDMTKQLRSCLNSFPPIDWLEKGNTNHFESIIIITGCFQYIIHPNDDCVNRYPKDNGRCREFIERMPDRIAYI